MKILFPILISALLLGGCAHGRNAKPAYVAPVAVPVRQAVEKATVAVKKARPIAAKIQKEGTTAGSVDILTLVATLDEAEKSLLDGQIKLTLYEAKVGELTEQLNKATDALNKAVEAEQYWRGKHSKALKELWVYRSIIIAVGLSIAGYVAVRLGFRFFF